MQCSPIRHHGKKMWYRRLQKKPMAVAAGWASKHPSGTTSAEVTAIETAVNCRSAAASPDRGMCTTSAWVVPFRAGERIRSCDMNNGKACGLFPSSLQWGPRHSGMSMYACSVEPIDLSRINRVAGLSGIARQGSQASRFMRPVDNFGCVADGRGADGGRRHDHCRSQEHARFKSLAAFRRHTPEVRFQLRGMT